MLIDFNKIKEIIIPNLNGGDGEAENLKTGMCHYCPKNSSHSIINASDNKLILFTVVCEC